MKDVHHRLIDVNCDNYEGLSIESTNGACHGLASIEHKFSRVTNKNSQGMLRQLYMWTCTSCLAHRSGKIILSSRGNRVRTRKTIPPAPAVPKGRPNATGLRKSHLRKKWLQSHIEAKYF